MNKSNYMERMRQYQEGSFKGMTTAQRKDRYIKDVGKQAYNEAYTKAFEEDRNRTYGLFTRQYIPNKLTSESDKVAKPIALEARKSAVTKASDKFDEVTKYDDMLGRATNPYKYQPINPYKYQPGGMRMYGDPRLGDQTFSNIVYQESEAGKEEALKKQMEEAQADNTAMEEANAALNKQYAIGNRIEATGQTALQAGAKGLKNLVTPEVGKTVAKKVGKEVGKAAVDPLLGQTPNWAASMIPNAAGETASLASGTASAAAKGALTDAATGAVTDAATGAATNAAFTPSVNIAAEAGTNLATDAAGKSLGKLGTFAAKYANPQHFAKVSPYAIAGTIAGQGIKYLSDDNDATTMNFGEGAGGVISGMSSGAGFGSMLGPVGTVAGGIIGGLYGLGKGLYQRKKARNAIGGAEDEKTAELNSIGANIRAEGVKSREYSGYDFGRTLAEHGGVRLPGGTMNPIPGSDAVEFKGNSHKQGGILLDEQTEVEGGETMDKVTMKDEGPSDYFFSKYLKLGGQSFAQRHKQLLNKGGTQQDIDALAKAQEKTAGRNPGIVQMERGGVKEYQYAGPYSYTPMNPMLPNYQMTVGVPELQLPGSGNQIDYLAGIRNRNQSNSSGSSMRDTDPTIYSQSQPNYYTPTHNETGYNSQGMVGFSNEIPGYQGDDFRLPATSTEESGELPMLPYPDDVGNLPVMYDEDGKPVASTPSAATTPAVTTDTREEETPITSIKPKPLPNIVDDDTPVKLEIVQQIQELESKKETQGLTDDERKALNKLYRDVPMGAYAAGAAQMIPAAYAFLRKEKAQKLMGPAGRIGSPKLDRVDFNKERSQNASDARALNKSIETSGSGPAGIIAKMAAFKRKQDGDMQIATAETRANAEIQGQEAQMKQRADLTNVQNAMTVDNVNTQMIESQRVADENRKYMALDAATKSSAGLMGDVLSYKADERLARSLGTMGIYERERLGRSLLGKVNPRTGKVYTKADIAEIYNINLDDPGITKEAEATKNKA